MAFTLERPAGFNFAAGQFITVTLPTPLYTDAKGNSRTFSIASPPQDAEGLTFATRMTGSALKRSLAEMPLGAAVDIFGPAGDFILPADARSRRWSSSPAASGSRRFAAWRSKRPRAGCHTRSR